MKVDVTDLHAPVMVRRLREKETAKGGIVMIPGIAKEKPAEDVLEVQDVQLEEDQPAPLDAKGHDRILLGIQIDDKGYLVIGEEEHLATLNGIANVASGNKQVPQPEGFRINHKFTGAPEGVFHWRDKL